MDPQGATIGEAKVTWELFNSNAGSITPSGLLTVGEVVGTFEGAVGAWAPEVDLVSTATVTIVPGPLERIGIEPNSVEIGVNVAQQFWQWVRTCSVTGYPT